MDMEMLVKAKSDTLEALLAGLADRVDTGEISDAQGAVRYVTDYAKVISDMLAEYKGR